MVYYVIANLRERAIGDAADTSLDATLNRFGIQADSIIDDELFLVANRNRRLTALPALPLPTPPQSLKDAATDLACALFLEMQRQTESAESYRKQAMAAVKAFIMKLDSESEFYGVPLD